MATIVNARDIPIQATSPRTTTATGYNAVTLVLSTSASVISANSSGGAYTLPSGITAKLYLAGVQITSGITFTPSTTVTQNGLSLIVNVASGTGTLALSGGSWTTDTESFLITATYNGVTYSTSYSIAKAKSGAVGGNGTSVYVGRVYIQQDASAGADPNFSSNTLLARFNGSLADYSTNTKTITTFGAAAVNTTTYKWGSGSISFNGSTSTYAKVTHSTELDLISGDFTIEFWANRTSGPGVFLCKDGLAGSAYPQYIVGVDNSGVLGAGVGSGNGVTYTQSVNTSAVVTTGVWHHIAFVRSGTTLSVYMDGTRQATATQTGSMVSGSRDLYLGYQQGQGVDNAYNGLIDDIRITKGVARYTGTTYTVPTAEFPLGAVATPTSGTGSYNFSTNTLTAPSSWSSIFTTSSTVATWVSETTFSTTNPASTVTAGTWSTPVVHTQAGTTGSAGSSIYVGRVYKQIASTSAPTAATGTYNFTTNVLTPPSGWTAGAPSTTTTPTWVSEYTFTTTVPGATVTAGTWSTPVIDAQAGSAGSNGISTYLLEIYSTGLSSTPTATTATYNFSTDTFTPGDLTGGWSRAMPTVTTTAVYRSAFSFTTSTPATPVTAGTWSTPIVVAQNGSTGGTGPAGQSNFRVYIAATIGSPPSTPGTTTSGGVPAGWSATPVTLTTGQVQYQSDGNMPSGTTTTTWLTPYQSYLKIGNLEALGVSTGALSVDGLLTVNTGGKIKLVNGSVYSGAFTGWGWPASGTGFYLGPEGLLMGNNNTGGYVEIDSSGNYVAFPGFIYNNNTGIKTLTIGTGPNYIVVNLVSGALTVPAATVTGTLTAANILAESITASKLAVSPSNICPDPDFLDQTYWNQYADANGWFFNTTTTFGTTRRVLTISASVNPTVNTVKTLYSFPKPFSSVGQAVRIRARGYNSCNVACSVKAEFMGPGPYDSISTIILTFNAGVGDTILSGIGTVPANTTHVRFVTQQAAPSSGFMTGTCHVTDITLSFAASADLIVDGAVTADKVAAGSIQAQHVLISPKSLNLDPSFAGGLSSWYGFVRRLPRSDGAVPASCPAAYATEFNQRDNPKYAYIDVIPGEQYRATCWVNRGSGSGGVGIGIYCGTTGPDGATVSTLLWPGTNTTASGWQKVTGIYTIPAGAALLRYGPWADRTSYTGESWYTDLTIEKLNDTDLIVDGAITANKVNVDGTITVGASGAIRSGQTAYDTGAGWWIGAVSGVHKLSIGSASGNRLTYDSGTGVLSLVVASSNLTTTGVTTNINGSRMATATSGTSTAYVQYTTDGLVQAKANGGSYSTARNWYSPTTGSIGTSYYIKFSKLSGSTPTGTLDTWLQITSNREVSISNSAAAYSEVTCTLSVDISTSNTGSPVVASGTVILTAIKDF